MGKLTNKTNIRVEVEPRSLGDYGWARISGGRERTEKQAISDCEDIAEQIRRHVDGLPSYGDRGVCVVWDVEEVCEHCGSVWSEGDSPHNGGCCAKDCEAFDAANETP